MRFASIVTASQAILVAAHFAAGTPPTSINISGEIEYLRAQSGQDRSVLQTKKCIEPLGCFRIDGEWSKRPVNLLPADRSTIGTAFLLFTRRNPTKPQVLVAENAYTIAQSYFVGAKQTKIAVHGYLSNSLADWVQRMNSELLLHADYNVISVDWGGYADSLTWYTQAVANTRVVGAEIALLINALQTKAGSKLDNVHIIGYSLGAHAAGYAGQAVKGIGRITGLDPAGPYFEGYSTDIRLDPSDASFVDVIHTDGDSFMQYSLGYGGFGLMQASGHADFYPNGGHDQPGCSRSVADVASNPGGLLAGLTNYVTCDHSRATELFTYSINNDCNFVAYECSNYSEFVRAKCSLSCNSSELSSGRCNKMGLPARKPKGTAPLSYYGYTSGVVPFCATSYIARVEMDPQSNSIKGKILLSLKWPTKSTPFMALSDESIELKAGQTYGHVLNCPRNTGDELVVTDIKWQLDLNWWDFISKLCTFFKLCSSEITIKKLVIQKENTSSLAFCSTGIKLAKDTVKNLYSSRWC